MKRDIILVAGLLLFMIGLIPFMSPAYAVIIVILMYFGIKFYVAKRRQQMERDVGEGICLECGAKIHEKNAQIVILLRNNSYVVLKTENSSKFV